MSIHLFSGFPPNLPTRAFHSSEESIYGAAGGGGGADFLQVPLRDHSNVSETDLEVAEWGVSVLQIRIQKLEAKLREERQAKKQLEEQLQQVGGMNLIVSWHSRCLD